MVRNMTRAKRNVWAPVLGNCLRGLARGGEEAPSVIRHFKLVAGTQGFSIWLGNGISANASILVLIAMAGSGDFDSDVDGMDVLVWQRTHP